jgi:cysteine desulfurase
VRRKPRVRIEALIHGGGHERGMRSGTLATHQIVGMGEAFRLAREEMAVDNERARALRDKLLAGLSVLEETYVNGDLEARVPHNLNISFNFVEGESLMMAMKGHCRLQRIGLYFREPRTLLCIARAGASRRTRPQLDPLQRRALHDRGRYRDGVALVTRNVQKLRDLSPLWEMHLEGIDLSTVQWAAH